MLDQIPDPASMDSFLKNLFQKGKFSTMFLKVRFVIVEMIFSAPNLSYLTPESWRFVCLLILYYWLLRTRRC
jgi:hypothetical protein